VSRPARSACARNLLRNAIDYTPAGGRVLVLCRRAGAELRIEVHGSGPGVPANMKSQLFEAFARADRTRPEGMGLGLFIVKCAADLLQHRIEVHSELGQGSCFAVVAKAAHAAVEISHRLKVLKGYLAAGGWPPKVPAGAIATVRAIVEQMMPRVEAEIARGVRLMAAAAIRDDGSRAVTVRDQARRAPAPRAARTHEAATD
jgi:phosphoglycerate-specific signal transduction histidine kinase